MNTGLLIGIVIGIVSTLGIESVLLLLSHRTRRHPVVADESEEYVDQIILQGRQDYLHEQETIRYQRDLELVEDARERMIHMIFDTRYR